MSRRSYLTPQECADLLRVHKVTMYRWIRDNKVPYIRLPSGDVRIPEDELDRWLDKRHRSVR